MYWLAENPGAGSLVAFVSLLIAVCIASLKSEPSHVASFENPGGLLQEVPLQAIPNQPIRLGVSPTKSNSQAPNPYGTALDSTKNRVTAPAYLSDNENSAEAINSAESINAGHVAHANLNVPEFEQQPLRQQSQLQNKVNYARQVQYLESTETTSGEIGFADNSQAFTPPEDASSNYPSAAAPGQFTHLDPPVPVHPTTQIQHYEHHQGINHYPASTETTVTPQDSQPNVTDAPQQLANAPQQLTDAPQQLADAFQQFTTLEDILQRLDKLNVSGESVALLKQLRQFRIRDLGQIWSELNLHFSNSYRLPLMTAVQSGIDRNLTALNQRANVGLVQSTILQAESLFEPQLNLNVNNNNGSSALSPVGGAPAAIPGTDNDLNGLSFTSQLAVPNKSGGTLQLANSLVGINDSLDSVTVAPTASFVQPLLRGAGRDVNLSGIRAAELNTLAAGKQAEETTFLVAAQIKVAYLDLFLAQENLRIFDWIVQVAEFQDRWITARKEAGAESSLNVRRGRTGLGNLKLQLHQATQQALLAERVLKELMLLPEVNVGSPIKLELEDIRISKEAILPSLSPEEFTTLARQLRPELQRLNFQIEAFDQNLLAAENQIRPQVNLIGSLSGQLSSAETGVGAIEDEFHQVSLGVNTNFPLRGNQAAKAAVRQIMAQRQQAIIVREQQDVAIVREVNDAVDQLVFSWRRIKVAREIIENANLAYIGEILTVQRADLLLQATQTLADAFTNFNQAVRDYYVAEINLQLATGSVLNHKLQLFR